MTATVPIPEGLADVPPGPELSRALADIDLSRLSGWDCVEVLKAQYRQANHERARLMSAMVEVGRCDVGPDDQVRRVRIPDGFAGDEIRAALVLTRRAADQQFWLAYDLLTRLPAVHAALDTGALDEPRARVLSEWTADLTPEQARALCASLLPRTRELTTGQLIELVKKMAIAIDPEWARRRYERAVTDRKVVGSRNPDGTANLSGVNLPVDRVAAASGRIAALARSAKNAGDARPVDHIRADLFLGMTDGTYSGLDDAAILDRLVPDRDTSSSAGPGPVQAGVELRVRLSTLLGYDEAPSELAGWGPVHAEMARDLAATLTDARWWFAITDDAGRLLHSGITRARLAGTCSTGRSRNLVQLQVPLSLLRELADQDTGHWAAVVTDLFRQSNTGPDHSGDADRRMPGAALRRHVQVRGRHCTFPTCRAPATSADVDHTLDHARGGATTAANLGGTCTHDHRLKHDGGWHLRQPRPGHFVWTSRLGHHHPSRPPPVIEPLPEPMPRNDPPF